MSLSIYHLEQQRDEVRENLNNPVGQTAETRREMLDTYYRTLEDLDHALSQTALFSLVEVDVKHETKEALW